MGSGKLLPLSRSELAYASCRATSLYHNVACRCFRLWCGRPACTENVEAPEPAYASLLAHSLSVAVCADDTRSAIRGAYA